MLNDTIISQLNCQGFALLPSWRCESSTIAIARAVDTVIEIDSLLPGYNLPTVQTLTPQRKIESSANRYSGVYGYERFPFHTDLAHWARPPRYILIRCKTGSPLVTTNPVPEKTIESEIGPRLFRKALVRPRTAIHNEVLQLLPLTFFDNRFVGYRWDQLFLKPMNEPARIVKKFMSDHQRNLKRSVDLVLEHKGDTLIIDNWSTLHSRSAIREKAVDRVLERVYLSDLAE